LIKYFLGKNQYSLSLLLNWQNCFFIDQPNLYIRRCTVTDKTMDRMTNHYKNLNNSNWLINVQDIMLDGYILIVFCLPLWNCHRHQFLKRPLKIILQVALGRWQCILLNTILTILSDSVGIWYHNFKFATWLYDLGFFGVICFQTKST